MSEKKQLNLKLIKGGVDEPTPPPSPPKPMGYLGWAGLWIASLTLWVLLGYWMWMAVTHR